MRTLNPENSALYTWKRKRNKGSKYNHNRKAETQTTFDAGHARGMKAMDELKALKLLIISLSTKIKKQDKPDAAGK